MVRVGLPPDGLSLADSNSSDQRLTAATGDSHNSRTIRSNLGYVRPENGRSAGEHRIGA
jgi:hypothetical protein